MAIAESRLLLAERLVELAEHSSEIEMRTAISRIYYAAYHLSISVVGNAAHGELPILLEKLEPGLGSTYRDLLELRQKSDYDPDFVPRRFGTLENFRIEYPRIMESARYLYERLRSEVVS